MTTAYYHDDLTPCDHGTAPDPGPEPPPLCPAGQPIGYVQLAFDIPAGPEPP